MSTALAAALSALAEVAGASFGPAGSAKIVLHNEDCDDGDGDSFSVTAISRRLLPPLRAPADRRAAAVLATARETAAALGDGGLLALGLTARLLRFGLGCGLRKRVVAQAFSLAAKWCHDALDDPSCPVRVALDWKSHNATQLLIAAARSVLVPKLSHAAFVIGGGCDYARRQQHLNVFSALVARSFLRSLPSSVPQMRLHIGEVRVVAPIGWGSAVDDSALIDGVVLPDSECTCNEDVIGARIALFSSALDGDGSGLLSWLKSRRVGVVASQRTIALELQEQLEDDGIVSLERLSARHIDAVSEITGAAPLGSIAASTLARVGEGCIGTVTLRRHFTSTRPFLVLAPGDHDRTTTTTTMLLCGARDRETSEELQAAAEGALTVLRGLLGRPVLVAGAGCTELFLARAVATRATSEKLCAVVRLALVDGFCACLEQCAACIDRSFPARDLVEACWEDAGGGGSSAAAPRGWDPLQHRPCGDVVLDALLPKESAIDVACETASALLPVDGACVLP